MNPLDDRLAENAPATETLDTALNGVEASPPKVEAETKSVNETASPRPRSRSIRWEWNLPLLAISLAFLFLFPLIYYGLYVYQTHRVVRGIWSLADRSRDAGDFTKEARWLNLLVTFDNEDREALVRLANATNREALTKGKSDRSALLSAKGALTTALGALDDQVNAEQKRELRQQLIQRLLDLGGAWAGEAESQVIQLQAEPENPDALGWLALSLNAQVESGEWRPRNKTRFDRERNYWQWISSQSVGEVLQLAHTKNPDSIDLSIAALNAYATRKNYFEGADDEGARRRFADKIQNVIQSLKNRQDGRAQWASYFFAQREDPSLGRRLLAEVAPTAVERFSKKTDANAESNNSSAQRVIPKNVPLSGEDDWNIQLIMAYASDLNASGEFEKAYDYYRQLIDAEGTLVSKPALEAAYAGAGEALWKLNKKDEAKRVWNEGCDRIGPLEGLALWHTIAFRVCESGNMEEANQSLNALETAIQRASTSLRDLTRVRAEERAVKQTRVDAVKWYGDVLRAGVDMRTQGASKAIQNLTSALTTRLPIIPAHRGYALSLLAKAYSEVGIWDLAARASEEAIALLPNDKNLRRQAAEAWSRAGGSGRALEQLRSSDDGSFDFALSMLQSAMASQRPLPPSQRDASKIKQLVIEAGNRLQREKRNGNIPAREWLFESLLLSPEAGISGTGARLSIREREEKFIELIGRYPEVAELQSLAVLAFYTAGKKEEARVAVENLQKLKPNNLMVWFETRFKLALLDSNVGSIDGLIDEAVKADEASRANIYDRASRILESAGRMKDACRYLKRSAETLSEADLFRYGTLLLEIESSESDGDASAEKVDPVAELTSVINALQEREGEVGTHWRILKASQLFRKYLENKDSKLLAESAKLQADVIAIRPRWSLGLALGGEIAAEQGKSEKAVELFQRAIAEGDNRVATIYRLVRELNSLGRFAEAEIEFDRIASFANRFQEVSALAIGIAQRKGQHDQALALAREGTARKKSDPLAWLFRAQAALMNVASDSEHASELFEEAEKALDEANRLSGTSDINVWVYKLRFASQFQGREKVQQVTEDLAKSNVPEKRKNLLLIRAYLQLRDFDGAKRLLDEGLVNAPRDLDLQTAMAEYYRAVGNQPLLIETLEELVRMEPKRDDFRKALAMELVTSVPPGGIPPWDRVASLIGDSNLGDAESSQLYHAMLLATRGNEAQLIKSKLILKELAKSKTPEVADQALRLSIAIEQKNWMELLAKKESTNASDSFREIKRLYDLLVRRRDPPVNDLVQYADFLLRASKTEEVSVLIDRISAQISDSPVVLYLRLRLAKEKKQLEDLKPLVDSWVKANERVAKGMRASMAGKALIQVGFDQLGVEYLQQAYREEANEFRPYAFALSRIQKNSEAIDVCIEQAATERAPDAIAILAEIAFTSEGLKPLDDRIEKVFTDALEKYPKNATVLESIGTLRLNQQRYEEAYELLRRAEAIVPNNLMTLNNLAVVTAEMSGKAREGLPRINRAIDLYGKIPELLDTLGVVQFQCGMLKEAEANLREAVARGADPRFRLHLIQVLGAGNHHDEIKKLIEKIDIDQLRQLPLTAKERVIVEELSKTVGKKDS